MKMKNFFAVALAAVTLFSCTTEVTKYVEKGGTTRVKVGVSPDVKTTRAGHTDGTPTADELKIYNYALFIFNSAGMLEASLIATPYSVTENDPQPLDYDYNDADFALEFTKDNNPVLDNDGVLTLSAGTKMFFAIVNAPSELLSIQNDYLNNNTLNRQSLTSEELTFANLSSIVGAYNVDENGNPVTGANVYFNNPVSPTKNNRGFMMTTIGTNGYEEQYLPELEDGAAPVEVNLTVGRAMAKVSLGTELPDAIDPEVTPNGTLDVESYKIINNPSAMYIMPNITNSILTTPYYFNERTTLGTYFASHNSSHSDDYVTVSTDAAQTFNYCIENANLTPRQGNATIAVVKGVFTPGGNASRYLSPVELTPVDFNKGDDFYRIWIPQYTRSDNGQLAGGRYDGNYYSTDPTLALAAYVILAQTDMAWPSDIQLVVEKYTGGVCYYRLPLYNSKNAMAPYTVKRNSYYQIDIMSVTDAGYTDEDGGDGNKVDPEEPLEPQTHITVNIKVSDWDEIPQGGNL